MLVLVEDLDGETRRLADGGGALGEHRGRQHVRRLVAELAGDVARLAEDAPALDRRSSRGVVSARRDRR